MLFFSSHHLYLIDALEHFQRHFIKRLFGLYDVSYIGGLTKCIIESLELDRSSNDLILMYKILHDHTSAYIDRIELYECRHIRGNMLKLANFYCKLEVRKLFLRFVLSITGTI